MISINHFKHNETQCVTVTSNPLEVNYNEVHRYATGFSKPNYPLPAIPEVHQWDYSLWCMLVNTPPMTDEEWEREEEEWQDYLDTLD